jgi:hypothetical protein
MSGRKYDTNQHVGKLTLVRLLGLKLWLCRCLCGKFVEVKSDNFPRAARRNGGCRFCFSSSHRGPRKDIEGERQGLLTAESPTDEIRGGVFWIFRCDCGGTARGKVSRFHKGSLRSCGCIGNAYWSWKCMMGRCYNPDNNRYNSYGGRGIRVHGKWHTFTNFIRDMGERPLGHTLSRIHAEKDYGPDNCKWEPSSRNTIDTCNGIPTKAGSKKGARVRVT